MFKIDQEKINKYLKELELKRKKDKQENKREERKGGENDDKEGHNRIHIFWLKRRKNK